MQKNKVFHILSYIPILFVISLFIPDKEDPSVRFHCGQGMILTIFGLVAGVIIRVLTFAIGWIPFFGAIICLILSFAVRIAALFYIIWGIYKAAKDLEEPLPLIGQYAFYK